MRRIARHLLAPSAAVSLLLCVAAAGAWLRSGFVGDAWAWYGDPGCPDGYAMIRSASGRVRYTWSDMSEYSGLNPAPGHTTTNQPGALLYPISVPGETHFGLPGFRFDRFWPARGWLVQLHYAIPLSAGAALPLLWLLRYRRCRRRRRRRRCGKPRPRLVQA